MEKKKPFQWQTRWGEAVTVGEITVTPESRALALRWPHGGVVWNRPTAILVERDGESERIPIVDVTRMAQVGLIGLGLIFSVVLVLFSIRGRMQENERAT